MRHEVRLLGPWELRIGNRTVAVPGVRMRILLTSLALSVNQTVNLDTLAEQVWPEQPPQRPHRTLHTYVARLRKLLGPEAIGSQPGGGYRLRIAAEAVDLHRFRDLERRAQAADSPEDELALLRSALELWRGVPFADLYSTWLDREVLPWLTEEWLAATSRRIELELATRPPEPLIAELQALADGHPTRELVWLLLITALHRAGRRADALRAYQRARTILREVLGIEPGEQLTQLQREILVDGTVPTRDGETVPRQLPHDIPRFTGRADELVRLDASLADTESARVPIIVAICGAPGVGKTTLAVHWAHRVAHRYPGAQLYLNLRGYGQGEPLTREAAEEKLLRALGVASAMIPSKLDERAALVRAKLSERAALIVLDNARDAEQVRPLLPEAGALAIVTSRSQLPGLSRWDGVHRVTLYPLSQQLSVDLLTATLGVAWVAEEPEAVAALVELCGRLPLALAIVAERAQRAGSLAQVVTELECEQSRLDALDTWGDLPNTSLRAALSWSYQALSSEPAALFRTLGLHPANDIDVRAAAALADLPVPKVRVLLDQLVCAHLVEQRRPDRYELHDLIRLYANEMAAHHPAAERAAAVRRVLDWYLHAAVSADAAMLPHRGRAYLAPYEPSRPPPNFFAPGQEMAWFEREYDCLRAVAAWAARHDFAGHAWRIVCTMAPFLHRAIPSEDGTDLLTSMLAPAEAAGELAGVAYLHYSLGRLRLDMGSLDAVRSHNERALAGFRSLSDWGGETLAMGTLAMVHGELGEVDVARHYATEALRRCEKVGNPRGIAFNLANLGGADKAAGEYERAMDRYLRAIAALDGTEDLEVEGWSQQHLAQCYAHLGRFPNAVRAFRRAIALARAGGNRRWEAVLLADLGTTLTDAGHPAIARALWQIAVDALREFADPRAQEIESALAR